MHGALSLAAVLFLAPAQAQAPAIELGADQCRSEGLDFFVGLGPRTAPTTLRAYLDPTDSDTSPLRIWLELRRIIGERDGELRLELVPTRGGLTEPEPESDSVRVWFMAVAALGRTEEALRLLERQDWPLVATQLRNREGRVRLARELDLELDAIEHLRSGPGRSCLRRDLERGSNHLAAQTMGQRASVIGVVDRVGNEQIQHVDSELTELRTQLDVLIKRPGFAEQAMDFVPFGPALTGQTSRLDRTFPETGVLVGGEALPHRLVIFVEDEEHGRLPDWLSPAMQFRSLHPGELSVQLVAAGLSGRAVSLRRRLCAARTLGLEVEYLLHLAERPAVRRLHETDLYEILQPIADSDACSDNEPLEPRAGEDGPENPRGGFGHPRGAWLDGRPVNPSDLESLEWQLDNERPPSIIDWLTNPDNFVTESFGFEF